jgi:hypothetical protein
MKYFKILGLIVVLGACVMASNVGVGTASATTFYKYTTPGANDALGENITFVQGLSTGFSFLVVDTNGNTSDTCTGMGIHGHLRIIPPRVKITSLVPTGCSHTTDTLVPGEFEIKNIAGTTNGTVVSIGMELTVQSTVFGASCIAKTGAGTTIGTLTGAKSSTGTATMDINGVVPMGLCGDAAMTGTFSVSAPVGLIVEP